MRQNFQGRISGESFTSWNQASMEAKPAQGKSSDKRASQTYQCLHKMFAL